MPRKKNKNNKNNKNKKKGKGKLSDAIQYVKNKIYDVNDYLKAKRFIHQIIGPKNLALPLNALANTFIPERVHNSLKNNYILKTLDNLGYGKNMKNMKNMKNKK